MRVLYNKERLDPTKYGDEKIIRESTMTQTQFDPKSPTYLYLTLKANSIEDETDFIQFGQVDQVEYTQMKV